MPKNNIFERSYKDTLPVKGVSTREQSNPTPLTRAKGMLPFSCGFCELPIMKHWKNAARTANHYCSHSCASKARRVRVKCNCEICGAEYETTPCHVGKIVTCSRKCLKEKRSIFMLGQAKKVEESPIFNFGRYFHFPQKLTDEQVIAIRNDKRKQKEIAEDYRIGQQMVSQIKAKTTWAHI